MPKPNYRRTYDAAYNTVMTESVKSYADELRGISGGERCTIADIMSWTGFGRTKTYAVMKPVTKFAGSNRYDVLTVARHFAELAAGGRA